MIWNARRCEPLYDAAEFVGLRWMKKKKGELVRKAAAHGSQPIHTDTGVPVSKHSTNRHSTDLIVTIANEVRGAAASCWCRHGLEATAGPGAQKHDGDSGARRRSFPPRGGGGGGGRWPLAKEK